MLTGFQTAFAEISSEPKTISPVIRKKPHTSTTDSFRFGGHVSLTKSIMLEHMKAHLLWKHKPLALLRKLGESTLFSITPSMPHKQYSFRFPSPLVSVCCRKCDMTFEPLVCFPRPKKTALHCVLPSYMQLLLFVWHFFSTPWGQNGSS